MEPVLVVAGEASGDRAAAAVVAALSGVAPFGMGGAALETHGAELLADLRDVTSMGIGGVARRALPIGSAMHRLVRATRRRKARAALLVGFSEFNSRLAAVLHEDGVRVLFYMAPQVWAWRKGRVSALRPSVDRVAVVLPFEEELWRREGVDAHYVGHPALETTLLPRDAARRALGLTPFAATVAILPGSRPLEVRRLLPAMLEGFHHVRYDRASVDARVLLAPSLDTRTRDAAIELARQFSVKTFDVDATTGAMPLLSAFDVAMCASGTASLEACLARAVPMVAYRVGPISELVARACLTVEHVALPNILLGESAFPELLQREVRPAKMAEALDALLRRRADFLASCDAVRQELGEARRPSHTVARMLLPWLDGHARLSA
jgi:lipid-A-disaccharide synthase